MKSICAGPQKARAEDGKSGYVGASRVVRGRYPWIFSCLKARAVRQVAVTAESRFNVMMSLF